MRFVWCVVFLVCLLGCQTAKAPSQGMSQTGDKEMLKSVASALGGKDLTDEEMKALIKGVKNDKEAQSAIESISNSLDSEKRQIQYCPLDGERYAARLTVCPKHSVELKLLN